MAPPASLLGEIESFVRVVQYLDASRQLSKDLTASRKQVSLKAWRAGSRARGIRPCGLPGTIRKSKTCWSVFSKRANRRSRLKL